LPVYGDGGNIRDWIHVEDHCRGILLALDRGKPGSTYCFGGDSERNNLDVVRGICRELDQLRPRADGKSHETAIEFVTDRPGHDQRYAIDDGFAQRQLGFKRKYTFEQGLQATVRWYLDNQAWCEAVTKKKNMERIGLGSGGNKA
jgi:dTDP-glucose 4,6-dehydratase